MSKFAHINTWVFDLDNTLYHPSCRLFDQIAERMTNYIVAKLDLSKTEAAKLRHSYYTKYGTTLRGLMIEHGMEPHDYLTYVHEIDYAAVTYQAELQKALMNLPGRKLVFTAGTRAHAKSVLDNLGCAEIFEEVFDITDCHFIPKPDQRPYEIFLKRHNVTPETAAFFEDLPQNLLVPRSLGMTTVLVGEQDQALLPAHVDYVTDDLAQFLDGVLS
jgi:putative hydrolase of the HAD superfamily